MEAPRSNHFDTLEGEMQIGKGGVRVAQNFPAMDPANHLGQYQERDPAAVASSKLQGYRASTEAMMSHNRRTERFLSPSGAQRHASKLKRPQVYSSGVSETAEENPHGFPVAVGEPTAGNGAGDVFADGRALANGTGEGEESRDETIERLTKVVRARTTTIKNQAGEIKRYKELLESLNQSVEDVNSSTVTSDQRVVNLLDDLDKEKKLHQKAVQSLEQKTREVEEQSQRLQEMEEASSAAHQDNLKLSWRLEEMNRLAEEQEQQRAEAAAVAEAATAAAAAAAAAAASAPERGNGGGGDEVPGGEELEKEVEKLKQMMEMKARQLEAVQERASKTSTELQYYKGQARSGRCKSFLLRLWWLLRSIGYLGFLLFAYVAVSEDALRSRGVDVYRLAH